MTRRMIDTSLWSNENFAALPAMARLLQIGIINHADDQGRIKAHPLYLAKEIFPYDRVTPTQISKWLEQIAANGTILLYASEGKQYAQLTKWWEYQALQYAAPSEYPAPPDWMDRIRRTATKGVIVTYNWTLTNGVTVEDTCDDHGKPLPPKPKAKSSLSSTSTPPVNGNGNSPVNPPVDSPESPPEHSIELNLINDQIKDKSSSPLPPKPPPKSNDDEETVKRRTLAAKLHSVGIQITEYSMSCYVDYVNDYGMDAVLRGITSAADNGKAQYVSYVEKCIITASQGGKHGTHRQRNTANSRQDDGGDTPQLDPEIQRRVDEHRERRRVEGSRYYQ